MHQTAEFLIQFTVLKHNEDAHSHTQGKTGQHKEKPFWWKLCLEIHHYSI